jgi:hypothetical protein
MRYIYDELGDGRGSKEEEAGLDVQEIFRTNWYSNGISSSLRLDPGQEDRRSKGVLIHSYAITTNRIRPLKDKTSNSPPI